MVGMAVFPHKGNELDEFVAELLDRVDECTGTQLNMPGTTVNGVWLHSADQIKLWIGDAFQAWRAGTYLDYDGEDNE